MDSQTLTNSGATTLNLLTRDGAVTVTFSTHLTGEQYTKLFDSIRDFSESRSELKERIAMLANEWGLDALADDAV
jgi:hypothetical protein